ncbi:hypothetical protein B0H13DRAFT_2276674 [Mycena leptocephala]|nr:hypothetical protein B0H13DRAFT_2276674 [Mycena leptocephala]
MGGATELMTPTHRTFSSLRRPLNHTIPPRHHPSDGERWERHGRFWRRHQRGGWQWNTDPVGRDGVAQPPGADCLQYGGTFERMGPMGHGSTRRWRATVGDTSTGLFRHYGDVCGAVGLRFPGSGSCLAQPSSVQ